MVACAEAHRAGNEKLPGHLAVADQKIGAVARDIACTHRTIDRMPRHRRQALKKHAALVIGALRRAETGIDSRPREALTAVASLLFQIMEQHAEGAYGSLLDEQQLEGVTPVTDRESLRVAALATAFAAAGVGTALLDAPEALQTYLLSGIGGCLVAVFYGGRTGEGFSVLDRIRAGR